MTTEANAVLVDTNVLVYAIQGHTLIGRFRPYLEGRLLLVSFQTVGELRLMAFRNDWGWEKHR